MAKVIVTKSKLDALATSISTKSGATTPMTIDEMKTAVDTISGGGGGITPTGTIQITSNGTHNVTNYASAEVNVQTAPTLQTKTKTYTPSASTQTETVTADSGYDGLQSVGVTVNPIPSQYIVPSGTKTISENGTGIDVSEYASVDVDVPSSGRTDVISGTFTTGSSTGTVESVTIPYTGTGFPIAAIIYIKGGAYNNTSSGDSEWYSSVQRYAVGQWTMHKAVQDSTPTFTTSGTQNQAVITAIYKNSTSSSTSYTRTSAMNTNTFSSSNASNAAATCVRFKSKTQMSIYVASTSYGLLANTEYTYHIIYSS